MECSAAALLRKFHVGLTLEAGLISQFLYMYIVEPAAAGTGASPAPGHLAAMTLLECIQCQLDDDQNTHMCTSSLGRFKHMLSGVGVVGSLSIARLDTLEINFKAQDTNCETGAKFTIFIYRYTVEPAAAGTGASPAPGQASKSSLMTTQIAHMCRSSRGRQIKHMLSVRSGLG